MPDLPTPPAQGADPPQGGSDATRARGRAASAATTGRSVAAGSAWHVASRVVPQAYTLVVSVVAARYLGPDGMGRQSFIAFFELSLIMLLTGGPFTTVLRYAGESIGRGEAHAVASIVRWAWRLEAVAAIVGASVLVGAAVTGSEPRAAWVLAGAGCALGVLHVVPTAVLIGLQRWREATIVGLITGLFSTAATIGVLAAGGGIVGMFAVEAASSAVILTITSILAHRAVRAVSPAHERPRPDPQLDRRLWRYTAGISLTVVLSFVVARRSEVFFLNHYSTDAEIAVYSIAFAAVTALLNVPEAIAATVTPAFATLFGAGEHERIRDAFGRGLRLMLVGVMPLTAVTVTLGPLLLRLVYGEEYRATGSALLAMAALIPLAPLFAVGFALVEGLGKLRVPVLAAAAGAVVDIALSVALIPRWGAPGAALANVAGQTALGLPLLLYASSLVGRVSLEVVTLARMALASVAAASAALACVHLLDGWLALGAGLLSGTVVLAGLAAALRVLPAADGAWLADTVGGRLPRTGAVVRAATVRP